MPDASTARYDAILVRNAGTAARDGTWLATDVWRPGRDGEPLPGPFPAVLVRTPYGRSSEPTFRSGEFWARRGYIAAYQDVRGRFESEGDFDLLANEGPDGYDAVEWVAGLPYCDGAVGTLGTSYLAWVQNALAIERPPHLRAMWVHQGGSNGNLTSLRHYGALELRWLTWAVSHGTRSPEAQRDPELMARLKQNTVDMYEWLRRLPWGDPDDPATNPLAGLTKYERWARDLYEHGDADEYWQSPGLNFEAHYDRTADVPTMYSGGWYDSYTKATTDNFVALKERLANQCLLMGPWTHGDVSLDRSWAGEVDLGPRAPLPGNLAETRQHLHLEWFDHWLRGVDNGVGERDAVRIFVMGGGSGERTAEGRLLHGGVWRDEATWPIERAIATDLHLHPDGTLRFDEPAAEDGGGSTFAYDPQRPLPTISANTSSLNEIVSTPDRVTLASPIALIRVMVIQGGADQRTRPETHGATAPYGPLEDRDDVLAFTTEPLEADLEVTGPIESTIYLSSDAPDTDLFVMLQDVYPSSEAWPEGYRLNIADGIMRVRYREGMDRPRFMEQGAVYRVRFQLYPTSNRFVAGHRMRVLVSSSSFPRFDVNPNTGEAIGRHTKTRVAVNTIHHSAEYPSRLSIPVVPAS